MKKTDKKQLSNLDIKIYSVLNNIVFCFRCTKEYYPVILWWCGITVLIKVLLPVIVLYLPKNVIANIAAGASVDEQILTVLVFTLSIALLSGVDKFAEKYNYFNKHMMGDYYMRKIAHKALETDYTNQEKETFRKLQLECYQTCSGNESALRNVYAVWIAVLSNVLGFVVFFAILSKLNLWVVIFLVVSTLISYFINKRVNQWAAENNSEKVSYHQKLNYIDNVSENVRAAKDIRIYHMVGWLSDIYRQNANKIMEWHKRYERIIFGSAIVDSGISMLREGVTYAYLLYLAYHRQISAADFVLYFAAITGFSGWLHGLLSHFSELNKINMSINRLRSFLEYPETFERDRGKATYDMLQFPCKIELRQVSYRYPGADGDTLHRLNLILQPSEHIAIVGLNGAGKTTLVKLICGLCDPTEGEVLYDGVNVREYNRRNYYELFSAVFQQFSILPLSVEEIVAEDTPDHLDPQKVEKYLKLVGLWDTVEKLPQGVKSHVDKSIHDDGVDFSGGEIQKLVFARALYKNAPNMILDEPTAALDPISESQLYEMYHSLMKTKTTVFISHRLASTRFCNRILLLGDGIVQEEGTHEQLIERKGIYYQLFETQAKYYRENVQKEADQNEG